MIKLISILAVVYICGCKGSDLNQPYTGDWPTFKVDTNLVQEVEEELKDMREVETQ